MRLLALTILATLAIAAPAGAATWHSYRLLNDKAAVEGGAGTHVARLTNIVLPDTFKARERATLLTFGPVGACRSTGTLRPVLVASTATTSAAVLAQQLEGGTTYGAGTRGPASWRVAKFSGGALKAVHVAPTRLAGIWVVVRTSTTPHATCHIGGVRESLGYKLADAYGTIRSNGY